MATILIVDTNTADRQNYITLLGHYGHRMLEAGNGVEALEIARTELPDLVITDIFMPSLDGFSLTRRLHAEPLLSSVPVIFHTTNYDETEVHKLAHASGIQHIIRKPCEPHEILRVVNDSLKRPASPAKLPQTGQLQREHLQVLADKLYQKVTELEDANEQLRNLSLTDELTKLNNKRGFTILAAGLIKFAKRVKYSLSLLYIDLDSLKYTNDSFGHKAGDTILVDFANILTETFRDSDILGRMGGDEYVVLVIDAVENDIKDMQSLLNKNVEEYNQRSGHLFKISFSMGSILVLPDSTVTLDELLAQADKAMYEHKQRRRQKMQ